MESIAAQNALGRGFEFNRVVTTVTMPPMNPKYLWLTDAMLLLTLYVVGLGIANVIAYAAWRGKPQNFKCSAIRVGVRRVRRDFFSSDLGGEVDQCRRQNPAIFLAVGQPLSELFVTWRGYGVRLPCTFTYVALAQYNTTRRPSSDRALIVKTSQFHSLTPEKVREAAHEG